MTDLLLSGCIALGIILGIISGLTPGLHLNNFAAMLLAVSPQLMDYGLSPFHMASIILAASISQTFFDAIPPSSLARLIPRLPSPSCPVRG